MVAGRGEKRGEMRTTCNSIINKIYFKKKKRNYADDRRRKTGLPGRVKVFAMVPV